MQPGQSLKMSVVHEQKESPAEGSRTAKFETGETYFAEDGGFGVISDIDDTIKVTQVRDRLALLKNTFVKDTGFPSGMMILRDMSWMAMEVSLMH